jgi:hypothetical protein
MFKYIVLLILILATPCFAQLPGDLNCNGYAYEVADAVIAMQILIAGCSWDVGGCAIQNGDIDGDGLSLTLSDLLRFDYIINGDTTFPNFQRHPESDTLSIASSSAQPGQQISLPVFVNILDTLIAFQCYIVPDSQYVSIDAFISDENYPSQQSRCSGNLYFMTALNEIGGGRIILPGYHHLGDLVVTVNPDIDQPMTARISFSDDPYRAAYSGLVNLAFFRPILINAEIQIMPTGIDDRRANNIPSRLSISAYPNPFNAQTTIKYDLSKASDVSIDIYDILGRKVRTLVSGMQSAGEHSVIWEAKDATSGVYFYRIKTWEYSGAKRCLLLK